MQHKSELGGVALGLRLGGRGAAPPTARLAALAAAHDGRVLAERMAPPGVELMVAVRTDAIVPALVLALGGIWTELLDDVAIVPLPADAARIERALRSLRGAPLLLGGRGGRVGRSRRPRRALAADLGGAAARALAGRVECNPVLVGAPGEGAVAVDAAIRLRGEQLMHDVVIVGGGFAGVTAARECALRGRDVVLLEARDRLGGRTWSADWDGHAIELGGAWVHWHQPHTFSELTRAGLPVSARTRRRARALVRRRRAARGHDRRARRDRPPRLGPLRRRRHRGAAAPARAAACAARARAL